uniref:Uncharacterized protein n=1 Tax=Desertifilum tharense IPPAS B-1220 TaxID=1781255 RepID=A0A1E5QCR4_9CYAN|nr:hypothetical protein BH720_25180 [Desertifilum tharense IPPAS B-1220]
MGKEGNWELGKKGIRSWELGVGEEEDGGLGRRRELGVRSWGLGKKRMGGWGETSDSTPC